MKMYLVLWAGKNDKEWSSDGLYHQREVAEEKLSLERLTHPTWEHALVEIDAPAFTEEEA